MLMNSELLLSRLPTTTTTTTPPPNKQLAFGQLSDDMTTSLAYICPWINGLGISFTIKDKSLDSCIENHSILLNTDDA